MKKLLVLQGPASSRSGYGDHTRDILKSLIAMDKFEIKVVDLRWGDCPRNGISKNDEHLKKYFLTANLTRQPDVFIQVSVPNEFMRRGKYNIGITAGMETTAVSPKWVQGSNVMDLIIVPSEHSKETLINSLYDTVDKRTNQKTGTLQVQKPVEVLFEGADPNIYKETKEISDNLKEQFSKIDNDFCFLYVGHWLQGNLGEDRKDTGMMLKVFLETFKGKKKKPALIMKTSGAGFSVIDRKDILNKIKMIKDNIPSEDLPDIYLLHGDLTDEEMNQMYNHPKVKAHLSFTHGEGFGRPLLEASFSGKPILAPLWSGQKDFLNKDYVVELQHTLTKVPKSAFPKEFSNNEALWATVNYSMASQAMRNIVKDYKRYELKGKKLMIVNRQLFSHEAMKEKLEGIVDKTLDGVPMQVGLTLPKLKKKGSPSSKIKLPKLKRG